VARVLLLWLFFAATSLVLIGALAALWERDRAAPAPGARTGSSAALYLVNQGILAPLLALGLAALGAAVHPERDAAGWSVPEVAFGLVAFEAVTGLVHRLHHRVPWLYRLHRVHHEGEEIGWLDAFRQHPLEFVLFQGLGNLPAVLLFGPAGHLTLWLNVGLRLWTAWLHARGPVALGPLEYVFTSPAMHHEHHRRGVPTRNFGGILSVFDWLGGTAARPAGAGIARTGASSAAAG
jgi:sterol desaturase/sphingolipid hydroxylase (fatty acid hydroxylase superfamily)